MMNRHFPSQLFVVICIVLIFSTNSHALVTYESSYSYNQTSNPSFSGGEQGIIGDAVSRTATTPSSTYTFNTRVLPDEPFKLRAQAGMDITVNGRGNQVGWSRVEASTTATTSLLDFGIVENFGNSSSGLIHFTWIVSGASTIKLDPILQSDGYFVEQLYTAAALTSTVEADIPEVLFNDQSLPLGQSTVDSFVPDSAGFQEFFVPWTANEEVPVVFNLEVTAALNIFNLDAAGFTAQMDADFTNTATLDSVAILDSNGNLLSEASFIGQNGLVYTQGSGGGGGGGGGVGAVPEPSTFVVWTILGMLVGLTQIQRRK